MINLFLTSSPFTEDREFNDVNNFKTNLLKYWKDEPNVLYIASFPSEYDLTDEYFNAFYKAFSNAGFKFNSFTLLDYRNINDFDKLFCNADIIILPGGHTPTEMNFFNELKLKDKLNSFNGLIIGISAGSMNLAKTVYAPPELDGEVINKDYIKFFDGLGACDINILPHHSEYKDAIVDGVCVYKDIVLKDSYNHKFYSYSDGTYIIISNNKYILYGEAFLIKDGIETKLTNNGDCIEL